MLRTTAPGVPAESAGFRALRWAVIGAVVLAGAAFTGGWAYDHVVADGGHTSRSIVLFMMSGVAVGWFGWSAWRDRAPWRILRVPMQALGLVWLGCSGGMFVGVLAAVWPRFVR